MTDRHLLWTILVVVVFILGLIVVLIDGEVTREEYIAVGTFMAGGALGIAATRGGKK